MYKIFLQARLPAVGCRTTQAAHGDWNPSFNILHDLCYFSDADAISTLRQYCSTQILL